jgi:hypothetical protein
LCRKDEAEARRRVVERKGPRRERACKLLAQTRADAISFRRSAISVSSSMTAMTA